jgi:hypothetical protein
MLNTKYQEIEQHLRYIYRKFLSKTAKIPIEDLESCELGDLMELFKAHYHEIVPVMEWDRQENNREPNREPLSRNWLLLATRNRYCHNNDKIDKYTELGDAINILLIIKSFKKVFPSDVRYLEAVSFLEYVMAHIYTELPFDQEQEQEPDNSEIKDQLKVVRKNVKN